MVARWRGDRASYLDQHARTCASAAGDGRVAVANAGRARPRRPRAPARGTPAEDWKLACPAPRGPSTTGRTAIGPRFRTASRAAVRDVAVPAFAALPRDARARRSCRVARPRRPAGHRARPRRRRGLPDADPRATRRSTSTPEEIHATGLAEIERIDARVRRARAAASWARRTCRHPRRAARRPGASASRPPTRSSRRPKRSLARAQAAIPDWFGAAPAGAACVVVPVPEPRASSTRRSPTTRWPALDGSRPGRYYINLQRRRRARATRPRRSPSTRPSRATTSRSPSPRS